MANVRMKVNKDTKLSPESRERLEALKDRPVDCSDIPDSSPEELALIRMHIRQKRPKRRMFSLRLAVETIEWWRQMGAGYTSVMARLLDEARNHPEWIRTCL
ncbi:MAG: BrnA antitoxin family protein [Treponema sp.]|jgi:hypothetical protein|nr:BrnA antitoxin family protein [Treponema sp.]